LVYDPLGRLFQTSGGAAGITQFLYDDDALIGEYDGGGYMLHRYIHGPAKGVDDPLIWYHNAASGWRRALVSDQQGSIIAVADMYGSPVATNAYDEYGIPGANNQGRFQYTGQAWIPELGMYHYKSRVYSPTLGRFLQVDSIGYEGGINLYAYVDNDPVNQEDPTGNCPMCWGAVVGGLIDGGIEAGSQLWSKGKITSWSSVGKAAARGAVVGAATGGLGHVARLGKALGTAARAGRPGRVMAGSTRGKNLIRPDARATGPHSTIKRGPDGKISNTAEWRPNPRTSSGHQQIKRVDFTGRPHRNPDGTVVPTPHVKEMGVKGVRAARPDELPR
jgi:RHS repeat-associated protein